MAVSSPRKSCYDRLINICLIITFIISLVIGPLANAQGGVMGLPQPGAMVNLSPAYVPVMIAGLSVHPENPLLMDFIVSTGNNQLTANQVKADSARLIKYFLACLTIPENNQWVNLSPYEKQRIVPEDLGQTVLGQDMLAQDYLLKQLTASLIYPEKNLGKNFWNKVYADARQEYGTTQIPVNTFNKVWILPDTAQVYEHNNTVIVVKCHLKVMLDEDYLSLEKHQGQPGEMALAVSPSEQALGGVKAPQGNNQPTNALASNITRQIVLPAIEQEVNKGQNFAQLRQIYNSMILAVWFKKNLKQALLNQVYTDKSKVNGVNVDDPAIKEKIYKQYLEAYKKGVFNYIKEGSFPPLEGEGKGGVIVARKYFSGGIKAVDTAMLQTVGPDQAMESMAGQQYFLEHGVTQEANGAPAIIKDKALTSTYHEQRARELLAYANRTNGALPMPTHPIHRMFRVEDVHFNIMKLSLEEKKVYWKIAWNYLRELSARNGHITWGEPVAGSASRMGKGRLPQILIDALKDDPEQFVDVTEFTDAERKLIDQNFEGDYKKYIKSLNPDIKEQHEVLDRVLHKSKALLPAGRPINGRWYNLLAYNAINVKRANDDLQAKGLNRIFIYKIMPNDDNYNKILQNLIQNNFYGLKVSVIRDAQGKIIDIDHSDVNNELVMYNQGLGYRLVAPVKTVEAQWAVDKVLIERAAIETDTEQKAKLLGDAQLKSEAAYKYALKFSQDNEGKVLYNTHVPEGHGERFHAMFETTSVGPRVPMIIQDLLRNVEYDYFHNIDNMAALNDDWMLIFGYMLKNELLMVLEASLRPSTERGGGGGFDWTEIDDGHGGRKLVYRQTEDNVTRASLGNDPEGRALSPEYDQKAEDQRAKVAEGVVTNPVPVNNASEFNKALTFDSILKGDDIISANLSPELRKELAEKLQQAIQSGDYNINLRKFSDALRQRFGVVSTIKSVADPNLKKADADQQILSIVNETFAWSSQEGALQQGPKREGGLLNQRMDVVLTPSIVDVKERAYSSERVRFDPLKDRPTYDKPPEAQIVRGALLKFIVTGELFSKDFYDADAAMTALVDEKIDVLEQASVDQRNQILNEKDIISHRVSNIYDIVLGYLKLNFGPVDMEDNGQRKDVIRLMREYWGIYEKSYSPKFHSSNISSNTVDLNSFSFVQGVPLNSEKISNGDILRMMESKLGSDTKVIENSDNVLGPLVKKARRFLNHGEDFILTGLEESDLHYFRQVSRELEHPGTGYSTPEVNAYWIDLRAEDKIKFEQGDLLEAKEINAKIDSVSQHRAYIHSLNYRYNNESFRIPHGVKLSDYLDYTNTKLTESRESAINEMKRAGYAQNGVLSYMLKILNDGIQSHVFNKGDPMEEKAKIIESVSRIYNQQDVAMISEELPMRVSNVVELHNTLVRLKWKERRQEKERKIHLAKRRKLYHRDGAAFAEPGGIDLNSKNLNLQSEGQKVSITFDKATIAQFKRGDFSGVRIQILDVVPINLMPLLGLHS